MRIKLGHKIAKFGSACLNTKSLRPRVVFYVNQTKAFAGAVGPAFLLSRLLSISLMLPAENLALPTSINVPTILRTILYKNPSASMSIVIISSLCFFISIFFIVLIKDLSFLSDAANDLKLCVPAKAFASFFISGIFNLYGMRQEYLLKSGDFVFRFKMI